MPGKLTWSHYCELLSINLIDKISYYIKITEEQNLSVRELRTKDISAIQLYSISIFVHGNIPFFVYSYSIINNLEVI